MKLILRIFFMSTIATVIFAGMEPGQSSFESKAWFRYNMEMQNEEIQSSGFQLARGYLVFKHQFSGRISSKFNIDIYSSDKSSDAGGAGLKIKAAYLQYSEIFPEANLMAGVIKNYFGTVYDWDYTTVQKALEDAEKVTSSADAGIAIVGYIPGGWGEYQAGIYNGEGYKDYGDNIDKHPVYLANVRFIPVVGLTVGGSIRYGIYDDPSDTTDDPDTYNHSEIAGVGRYSYGPFNIWAEYLVANYDEHTAGGFMIMPCVDIKKKFQIVGRYDMWDPDFEIDDDGHNRFIAGVNYFITKDVKGNPQTQIQLNWERIQYELEDSEPLDNISCQFRWEFKSNPF